MTDRTTGRLAGRIALITGASRGIGAAVATRFAAEGAHLILLARTRGGLEEVDDAIRAAHGQDRAATLLEIDLADFDQVDHIGPAVAERFGKLDIFVGNAGLLGELAPLGHIDADVWDRTMAVNVSANWRLIRTLEPLLLASDAGRAIFVGSGAGNRGRAYWGTYAVSKAALTALMQTWAAETEKTDLRVNMIFPGSTRTAMRAMAYPGEDPAGVKPPETVAGTFVDLAEPACTMHGEVIDLG